MHFPFYYSMAVDLLTVGVMCLASTSPVIGAGGH